MVKKISKRKENCSFIQFDVCEFHPSISDDLLNKALDFASKHVHISQQDCDRILQAKNSLLYSDKCPWGKSDDFFDVTIGSFDGAETCELIGLFLLSHLQDLGVDT